MHLILKKKIFSTAYCTLSTNWTS